MRSFFLFALILIIIRIYPVDLPINTSAVQNASAGLILLANSPSGTSHNAAYLHPGLESGVSYLFDISDLPFYTIHLANSYNRWGLYLGGNHLDHPAYKESNLNLTINYRAGFYAFGSSIRLLHNRVDNYHQDHSFVIDGGFILYYNNITTAVAVRNLSQTRFQGQILPVVFIWEINYTLSENSKISLGMEKERNYDFSLKIGAFYRLHPYFALLSSYQYEPDRIGAGVVLLPSPIRATYSIFTHRYLSPTHFFSIAYEFGNS